MLSVSIVFAIWHDQLDTALLEPFCAMGRSRMRGRAITLLGFCRGRPLACGTRTSASVASASVVSPGEALSSRTPSGRPGRRPVPSTSFPCRAWFHRRRSLFFRRSETAIQKGLSPSQQALATECSKQRPRHPAIHLALPTASFLNTD